MAKLNSRKNKGLGSVATRIEVVFEVGQREAEEVQVCKDLSKGSSRTVPMIRTGEGGCLHQMLALPAGTKQEILTSPGGRKAVA